MVEASAKEQREWEQKQAVDGGCASAIPVESAKEKQQEDKDSDTKGDDGAKGREGEATVGDSDAAAGKRRTNGAMPIATKAPKKRRSRTKRLARAKKKKERLAERKAGSLPWL